MKRKILGSLLVLASLAVASSAAAQAQNYQPVRVDVTAYGAYAPGDAATYGFGAVVEPKYNLTDQLALGLRLEGGGFVMQSVEVGGTNAVKIDQNVRVVSAYLAKAEYYLTTSPVRPFVGLGLGLYQIDSGSQSMTGGGSIVQQVKSTKGFGVCPQVGVNFGGFRLAATYHVITGDEQVIATQAIGAPAPTETKLSKNFLAFEIGGTIGGNRRP